MTERQNTTDSTGRASVPLDQKDEVQAICRRLEAMPMAGHAADARRRALYFLRDLIDYLPAKAGA